jgi:hypothetical protein
MDATTAPLPRAVIEYIAAFDLAALCRYPDGRLRATRDPEGAEAAWWCETVKAELVIRAAGSCPRARRRPHRPGHGSGARLGRARPDRGRYGLGRKDRACCTSSIKSTAAGGLKRKGEASGSWANAQATARLRRAITKAATTGTSRAVHPPQAGHVADHRGRGLPYYQGKPFAVL